MRTQAPVLTGAEVSAPEFEAPSESVDPPRGLPPERGRLLGEAAISGG